MSKEHDLTAEDIALFRESVGPIERVRHDRIPLEPERPRPLPKQTLAERRQVLEDSLAGGPRPGDLETGDELSFLRPGLQHKLLRKLRRGQFSIGAELDLHGLTVSAAREVLGEFLKDCRLRGIRAVRIVHGKGRRSPQRVPILKGKLDHWLRLRHEVVAFCSAPPADGGTGAIYVLLKDR